MFLVEDLDRHACAAVPADGQMIALPLRLERVSGSLCRVVVAVPG